MLKEKLGPELCVAIVLSAAILVIMGALSYGSKNIFFFYVGLLTVFVSIPVAIASNKT